MRPISPEIGRVRTTVKKYTFLELRKYGKLCGDMNVMRRKQIIFLLLFLLLSGLPAAVAASADDSNLQDPRQARIAVIIPEVHITRRIPDPAGETAIIRKLLEAGFTRVVDQNQINKIRDSDVVKALIKGDVTAAQGLAEQLGVDYIMVGEAFSEFVGNVTGGMISCRARVEARIIRTDNARIIAANGFHAGGTDLAEFTAAKRALNNAGEKMGGYMVEQLVKRGDSTVSGVKLTITGISNYSKLREIETALGGLKGVETVRRSEYGNGVATFDLTVNISVQTLADRISNMSEPRMEVTETSGSALKASVR